MSTKQVFILAFAVAALGAAIIASNVACTALGLKRVDVSLIGADGGAREAGAK